ncbi:MAG: site-specific DNA-methyltransferase [Sedimentisphaerales bacterium]|nr:site-specific DNA-methyltransferase [Sedimentisphaerales bacterium]
MESCVIEITEAAKKHGNLNVACCGKSFFPEDAIGGATKAESANPITIVASGLVEPVKTDIPSDGKTGRPRWIFRDRKWVREFVASNNLNPGDNVTIARLGGRSYSVQPTDKRTGFPVTVPRSKLFHRTKLGRIYLGDSLAVLNKQLAPGSVDLIVTSPPFGLVRKKDYGNVDADKYVEWFKPFGNLFLRLLKPTGSLIVDMGGSWNPGFPTRSLYHYELLLTLCNECGFHLAQEFFWWNPSKLPTPAEWVTVRRIRVKDAVNFVWWLSRTPWPKASNRRVLSPYSIAMRDLLKNGYKAKLRPSGHDISEKFSTDNKAAIPPNLIAVANTESNSYYLRYCKEKGLSPHPARFPSEIPEYFIRMLTDPGDLVVDPFAGSCVAGEVAQRLKRRWICVDTVEEYLEGAIARFRREDTLFPLPKSRDLSNSYYKIYHPGANWNCEPDVVLPSDGGSARAKRSKNLK